MGEDDAFGLPSGLSGECEAVSTLLSPRPVAQRARVVWGPTQIMHLLRALVGRLGPDQRAVVAIALASSMLSGWNLLNAPEYQDDEGTYTAQAFAIFDGKLAPYTYWYDHAPLGWIQLAGLSWLPPLLGQGNQTYVGQMRCIVALFFVASTVMVYLIARRLGLMQTFAVLAAGLFCLSPLSLVLGRQVFIDNIGLPWLLLSFYLLLSPQLKLWHHIGAATCFAIAVLSKETLAILGPALLVALLHRPNWKTRFFSLMGFLSVGGLLLSFFPLMAMLRGELLSGPGHVSLEDAVIYQLLSRPGSGSLFDPHSGRADLVNGWMYYDKYVVMAGLVAAAFCLLRREARWIPVGLVLMAGPVVVGQGYLPAMYIIAAIPFLVLAVAAAADLAWRCLLLLLSAVPSSGRHVKGVRRAGLGAKIAVLGLTGGGALIVITVLLLPQWLPMDRSLLTSNKNADWEQALTWAKSNIPRQDAVLVPYSMWQDVNADGGRGPWQAIALEKMDLDTEFAVHHPEGWRAVRWIVEGPPTARNIKNLELTNAGIALEHSKVVAAFGDWKIRSVIVDQPDAPTQAPVPRTRGDGQ